MCGRIAWRFDAVLRAWFREAVAQSDEDAWALAHEDRYNIAPTDPVVAVVAGPGGARARVAGWGFPGPSGPVFNARAEAARSPMWAPHWGRRHAVVPASGFFEWTGSGAGRTPFYVTRHDGRPLLFAALLGGPPDRPAGEAGAPHPLRTDGGSAPPSCWVSILTCAPNRFMARLHDRMPVVLEPDAVEAWLRPGPDRAWEALAGTAPEVLGGHAVGKAVGDVRAQGPRLIEPVRAWF